MYRLHFSSILVSRVFSFQNYTIVFYNFIFHRILRNISYKKNVISIFFKHHPERTITLQGTYSFAIGDVLLRYRGFTNGLQGIQVSDAGDLKHSIPYAILQMFNRNTSSSPIQLSLQWEANQKAEAKWPPLMV